MSPAEPAAPRPAADLTEVDLLLRLARRWRQLGRQGQDGQGLPPHVERGLLALARLSRSAPSGVRISRLAEHLGIAPRSATEVADALEAAGLARRAQDPSDRRAVLLTLTGAGQGAVTSVRSRRHAAGDLAVAALSPDDRADLRRLLLALLEDGPPGADPAGG